MIEGAVSALPKSFPSYIVFKNNVFVINMVIEWFYEKPW